MVGFFASGLDGIAAGSRDHLLVRHRWCGHAFSVAVLRRMLLLGQALCKASGANHAVGSRPAEGTS
jgi:hypothetical protein